MFAVADVSAQNESVSTIRGYESSEVHLTLDSGNDILEVRVEGCEQCKQRSYLPTRDIVINQNQRDVSADDYPRVSGSSGTIMFDDTNKMVFQVNFWKSRGEGEVK